MSLPALPQEADFRETGLILPADLDYESWEQIGSTLQTMHRCVQWWVGDWLTYGEGAFGERYAQAIEATDYDRHSLQNIVSVVKKFPPSRRREELPFSHHEAVSGLKEPKAQDRLLDEAIANEWSLRDLRKHVKSNHQHIHSSESNEWGTPEPYIEAVHEVMGGIDLDPASSATFNEIVRAARYFTEEDDGLSQTWEGRTFLNPPYGRTSGESNAGLWSQNLIAEYEDGEVTQAILLVNASTGEKWFRPLFDYFICFTDHRIKFYNEDGSQDDPTHSNVFVYFGEQVEKFTRVFSRFGTVVCRVTGEDFER